MRQFKLEASLLQSLAENLFGEQSPLVIVLSTLAIAALFNPHRIHIQDFINHSFYHKKFNAEQALAQFAATLRPLAGLWMKVEKREG